jgi:ABC-type spermidine/putrescine transport system permease subunit I
VAAVASATPRKSRVAEQISIVAALWLVWAVLTLFSGFFLIALSNMPFTRFYTPSQQQTIPFEQARNLTSFIQGLFVAMSILLIAQAAAAFLAAWGLLQRKPWARMLALILGFLALLHFPLGTALGIYTIWVFLTGNAEHDYHRLVASASR